MKKLLKPISLTIVLVLFTADLVDAQPQWKFHLAFEDATGSRDTIWFIWDTTATFYGADTALGEVTANIDYSKFNVWTHNYGLTWYDTIKIVAHPYNYSFGHAIEAINFELPITINWDSALLHADRLPPQPVGWVNHARIYNDYFFLWPNDELIHHFDMTLDDHVTAPDPENEDPWVWQDGVHFPMSVVLMQDPTVNLSEIQSPGKEITLYPNPVRTLLAIDTKFKINSIRIFDSQGKQIFEYEGICISETIDLSGLEPGIYVIQLNINQKTCHYEKIIKTN